VCSAPKGVALPVARKNNMETIEQIQKAFHKAQIEGSHRLQNTKTDAEFRTEWEKYAFVMLGFEAKLQSMGLVL
jgi:hypothetical protein